MSGSNTTYSSEDMKRGFLKFMGKVLGLIVIAILLKFLFFGIDSYFLSFKEKPGIVVDKMIIEEHRSRELFSNKDGFLIPFISKVEKEFQVAIQVNGKTDVVNVSEYEWDLIRKNDEVDCKYNNGRITNALYIKSFER
jgi:hypothetical protein